MEFLRNTKRKLVRKEGPLRNAIFAVHNKFFAHNKIRLIQGGKIFCQGGYIRNCNIIIHGNNSSLTLEPGAQCVNTTITMNKNGSKILIKNNAVLNHCEIVLYDGGEYFEFGVKSSANNCCFYLGEGKEIYVGDTCWFARGGVFRTGDGHSLCDSTGKRINRAESITIGDHCWIGTNTVCLKGTALPSNTVVSACSLLNKHYESGGKILGGIPARILRENITWQTTLIPFTE